MACSCKCCCGCCCDGEAGEQKLERQCTSPKEFQGKGTSCDVCCDLGEIREDIDSEEDCPGTWVVNGRCQDEPCDPCATCDPAAVDCYYAYYQMCYKDEFGLPDGGCGDCAPDVVLRVPCGLSAQARLDWWSANAPHTDSCYAQTYQLLNRYCCDGVCQEDPCDP